MCLAVAVQRCAGAQRLVCSGVQVCALFLLLCAAVLLVPGAACLPGTCLPGVLVLPVSFALPGTWCASVAVLVPGVCTSTSTAPVQHH